MSMVYSARYDAISYLGKFPALFSLYYRHHSRFSKLLVRPNTEIVIEGFPRCANSFAVLAFESAQPRGVRVAHHLHSSAQLLLGRRFNVPLLILLRDPESAVASLLTRHPEISANQALRQYCDFYSTVQYLSDTVVIADFRTVTTDYAKVISALNARFGTSFLPYCNSSENDQKIFAEIDQINSDTEHGDLNMRARPDAAKSLALASARQWVEKASLLQRAQGVFASIRGRAI